MDMLIDPSDYFQQLPEVHRQLLNNYKTNDGLDDALMFCDYLNFWLRERRELAQIWNTRIELLDAAINGNQCVEEGTLYRATCTVHIERFTQENFLKYPAYMSTSTGKTTPASFLRGEGDDHALLVIKCPIGTRMMAMEGITGAGGDESEFLLGRDTRMIINDRRKIDDEKGIKAELFPYSTFGISKLVVYYATIVID